MAVEKAIPRNPRELSVDIDRIEADLVALGNIGRAEDRGIYRMAFTEADMEGRAWLRKRIEEAGLKAHMDAAGNVLGRFKDYGDEPVLLVGSHLDSVPAGGMLDGTLGVIVALECLRRIKEEGLDSRLHPVELVAFSDEEGRFGGFFGSKAICGDLIPQAVHDAVDLDGVRLLDAMTAAGLDPMAALAERRQPDQVRAYLELHIEQGPILDSLHVPVGVVDGISGLFKWQVRLIGHADHAGTTPMAMRHDALMGLAEFAGEIPRVLEEDGAENSVATIGNAQLTPGSANTVPGEVVFTLDVRDADSGVLQELNHAMRRTLSAIGRRRGLMFEFTVLGEVAPVQCNKSIVETIASAAEGQGVEFRHMISGAAHDAQIMSAITPIGMIFVPSKDGRSHSTAEYTHMEDIEVGANTMLQSIIALASDKNPSR
jgi:N-carbamoyl-L-amino-acid hydrolase